MSKDHAVYMIPRSALRGIVASGVLLAGGARLAAQSTANTSNDDASNRDVVTLSEFNVSSEADNGYIATNSITGSRVATAIKDLTFNVNVVTGEFLNDFAMFEIDDFGYVSTVNSVDPNGSFNIRGYGVQKELRNGFQRIGLFDKTNIDRIEVIKGPSAAIYGETRPGGMLNIITKRPKEKAQQNLSFSAGSYNTVRADFSSTGPLIGNGKTFYRIDGGYLDRNYEQLFANIRQRTLSGSVVHRFTSDTNLWVEVEWLQRKSNPQSAVPYLIDPVSKKIVGLANQLSTFSQVGPKNSEANRDITDMTATFEHRFNPVFSTRVAANYYHRHLWTGNGGTVTSWDPSTNTVVRGAPGYGRINEDGGGFQGDLIANYSLFNGKVKNKTLATLDYSMYNRVDPQWRATSGSSATVPHTVAWDIAQGLYVQNLNILNPVYLTPDFTPDNYPRINRWNVNNVVDTGIFVRQQVTTFNDRLIAVAGARYDTVLFRLMDKADYMNHTGPIVTQHSSDSSLTPMTGANFKVARDVALYANYSRSFFPDSQNAVAKNQVVSETGWGWDYGTKISLLDDKLDFTLGGFSIMRKNVKINVLDEFLNNETVYNGTQKATGLELDGSYRPIRSLTLLYGYSYVNAHVTNVGSDIDQVGRMPSKNPRNQAYLATKYNFENGTLKGLSTNFGFRYTGPAYADTAGGGVVNPVTKLTDSNDGRRSVKTPGYTVIDLGFHYRLRTGGSRFKQDFGLNFKNLFDRKYVTTNRLPGDRFSTYFTYGIAY
jgi:outer membrane receptor protein involved in Fe transport